MVESVEEVLDAVSGYWVATHVPGSIVKGMRAELEGHLREAVANGRSVADVTGPDLGRFAEQWAEVHRPRTPGMPSFEEAQAPRRATSLPITASLVTAGVVVALALIFGREEVPMEELEIWRWVWTLLTVVFAVGEMLTAGFFLLPFAVGGAVAAVLAWIGVGVAWQWGSFLAVSVVSLVFMRRFTADAEPGPAMGANRYADAIGTIVEPVDPASHTGSVRVETEVWRASADEPIEAGAQVRVVSVSGTRMRVTRVDQ
jgi:membrane protein implicated in regulation of membrane protease activity